MSMFWNVLESSTSTFPQYVRHGWISFEVRFLKCCRIKDLTNVFHKDFDRWLWALFRDFCLRNLQMCVCEYFSQFPALATLSRLDEYLIQIIRKITKLLCDQSGKISKIVCGCIPAKWPASLQPDENNNPAGKYPEKNYACGDPRS